MRTLSAGRPAQPRHLLDAGRLGLVLGRLATKDGFRVLVAEAAPAGALAGRRARRRAMTPPTSPARRPWSTLEFDPVVAGPLSGGTRREPNASLFGADVDAVRLRELFDVSPDYLRPGGGPGARRRPTYSVRPTHSAVRVSRRTRG